MLLDIVMPEMDGVEVCARIRNDPRYADLPIIMVTSLDDMNSLANAFVAGATDYVTKPINRIELVARVRAALRLKQELDRRLARERELLAFLSSWGDRRAGVWIDEATGLFVGEVAEAYLAACGSDPDEVISVLALDARPVRRLSLGQGQAAARGVLAQVARAVRRLAATVGIVAAAYRNGMIILVAPELDANSRARLAETLARDGAEAAPAEFRVGRVRLCHRERGRDHRAREARRRPHPIAHPGDFQRAASRRSGRQPRARAVSRRRSAERWQSDFAEFPAR